MWQSAVAFWSVWLCIAIGCRNSDHNVTKYQIETSSMAPTWFGSHLTATCVECGQQSIVVSEAYDPALPTRCFSCGAVSVCKSSRRSGETVEVTQYAVNSPIRRFDVLTFDTFDAHDPSPRTLKRVWALPGERIELREGEAWIDRKRLQKSPRELATVSIPVSRFPKDTTSHWWVVDDSRKQDARIETAGGTGYLNVDVNQRLEFRYARPNRNPAQSGMLPSRIVDDFPFDQNSIAPFHEVGDFLLAIELDHAATSPWFVSLRSEGKCYNVRVVSNVRGRIHPQDVVGEKRLVFAICDGRLLTATEQQDTVWELVDIDAEFEPDTINQDALISITTTETLRIQRMLVARDQWLGPRESRMTEWVPSGTEAEIDAQVAEGYFVLGDNLQLSIDSRDVSVGRIAFDRIRGHVKQLDDSSDWILALLNHAFRDVGIAK